MIAAVAGLAEVHLSRGFKYNPPRSEPPAAWKGLRRGQKFLAQVRQPPASSYASTTGRAEGFSQGTYGYLQQGVVPADRILSYSATGFGTIYENEWAVLASDGRHEVTVKYSPVK